MTLIKRAADLGSDPAPRWSRLVEAEDRHAAGQPLVTEGPGRWPGGAPSALFGQAAEALALATQDQGAPAAAPGTGAAGRRAGSATAERPASSPAAARRHAAIVLERCSLTRCKAGRPTSSAAGAWRLAAADGQSAPDSRRGA